MIFRKTLAMAAACTAIAFAQSDVQKLANRALGETPLARDLRELCDGIGGRPTGSAACDRAVQWAAKKFREAGIQNVRLEPFTVPNLWLAESSEASVICAGVISGTSRRGSVHGLHQRDARCSRSRRR